MNISIVLAQIFGITLIVLGLSMIFNKKETTLVIEELVEKKSSMWLAGFITLILGTVYVSLNNIWTSGLPLVITILGWLTLIKGASILIFPNLTTHYYKKVNKESIFVFSGVIVFFLGIILILQ